QSDQKCMACHAGPIHHENQKQEDQQTCAACHRDHQGREVSLVRLADALCTRCHSNLSAHMTGPLKYQNSVTAFDANESHHPEFRSVKEKDPGNLKFNHALHLAEGMVQPSGGHPWKLSDIPDEAERARQAARQGTTNMAAPVRLDCASCHQLNAAEAGIRKTP